MEPNDLAAQLRITGLQLRTWLRKEYPRDLVAKGSRWNLTAEQVAAARRRFGGPSTPPSLQPPASGTQASSASRGDSDEAYVLDLCDELMGETALRQHRFQWLQGDPGTNGGRSALPVDGYYPKAQLVVEYHERQHDEAVAFFDKPDRLTVSGVPRGEQRRRYDERRFHEIPRHGLRYVVIRVRDLDGGTDGRLRRNVTADRVVIKRLLR